MGNASLTIVFLRIVEWRTEKRCGWNTLEFVLHAYAFCDHKKNTKSNVSIQTLSMLRLACSHGQQKREEKGMAKVLQKMEEGEKGIVFSWEAACCGSWCPYAMPGSSKEHSFLLEVLVCSIEPV